LPDGFTADPLVTAVMVACRMPCPSEKQMAWVDDLAGEFGEKAVIRALMKAAEEGTHRSVLKRASEQLHLSRLLQDRQEAKAQEERIQEGRADRARRQREAEERVAVPSPGQDPAREATAPQSMADLMGGLPEWYRQTE
jgi:hypothetical protein